MNKRMGIASIGLVAAIIALLLGFFWHALRYPALWPPDVGVAIILITPPLVVVLCFLGLINWYKQRA